MVKSLMGGIYEAQPAAEPGESVIFKTMTRPLGDWVLMEYLVHRWWKFLIRNIFAVAPEARSEGCQHPIPRLKKGDKVKRGYAHHG